MTMVKLYNTLTRKREEFKPIKTGKVGIYSCGPTVYWNQHIGHMYAYVQWDILVRFLRYLGFEVSWVMNITDVGHLTSDQDTGEDKMEKGAKREGLTVWQIADKYLGQFLESIDLLNIKRPDVLCRATEHLQQQIDLIKKIENRGFAYKTATGLVFDTTKYKNYAAFARLKLEKQQTGQRLEIDPERKNPWDFLLWVTNQPGHVMQWDSPWGRGFPGWHIECTAMSTKYLGESFDIHTGGIDHISVHHTNEVAQGYGAFGHQTAAFWLHNGWLKFKGEKISKSLGNFILVTDLMKKGYDPMALRYLILTSHYRQGMDFTWEGLESAQQALLRLRSIVRQLRETSQKRSQLEELKLEKVNQFRQRFDLALGNDLAIPQALTVVWEILKSNISSYDKLDLLLDLDQVLGLKLAAVREVKIPLGVKKLADQRLKLRKLNQWQEADQVRKEIEEEGFVIEDTTGGYWLKPIKTKIIHLKK
ncbi:MAG TPA: cysteine--tRNA ligase [Candidatus Bathyarchaeia archaeon]|nr:cysteine--tRNA ligase [Candidatus Bathyarchaeia archaeon]